MALADTAKLVASLELKDKFSKTAAAANASLSGLERKTSTLSKIGSQASAGVGSAVRNIKLIGLAAAGAIAVAIKQGLDSLASIQKEEVQTQTVLKSTAGIAGQTFATITARSKEWSAAIGVNQEDVQHLQNVLLTFTNIGPTIFDETTTAALNLSQALGQDLQSSAVQLGKAINDPIKGMTALRRVGVSFTAEQVAQVKAMVKAGKTLDAQRLILRELNTEFGGSAEAFGKTAAGQFEIFKQNVQAAERQLATAFLPLLLKLGQEANKILGDKGVQEGIKNFGSSLAGGISDFVDILKGLPWGSIGSAFKLMGSGAKFALDAFKSAPPWLQTAVLTGWGLNKLTGGALGKIAVTLGSDVLGSFIKRGGTPATPLFVADVTGGSGKVLGGGAPVAAAAGKGLLATVVPYALVAAGGIVIGKEVAQAINANTINPAKAGEQAAFQQNLVNNQQDLTGLQKSLDAINSQLNTSDVTGQVALIASRIPYIGDALGNVAPELEKQRDAIVAAIKTEQTRLYNQQQVLDQPARSARARAAAAMARLGVTSLAGNRTAQQMRDTLSRQNPELASIASSSAVTSRKNFSPNVNVAVQVTSNVTISDVQRKIQSQQISIGRGLQRGY